MDFVWCRWRGLRHESACLHLRAGICSRRSDVFLRAVHLRSVERNSVRGDCDACGWNDTPVKESEYFDPRKGRNVVLCEVCSSTHCGQLAKDRETLMNPFLFYRSLAQVANLILDAVHEMRSGAKR